jgi:hypothetical protein
MTPPHPLLSRGHLEGRRGEKLGKGGGGREKKKKRGKTKYNQTGCFGGNEIP